MLAPQARSPRTSVVRLFARTSLTALSTLPFKYPWGVWGASKDVYFIIYNGFYIRMCSTGQPRWADSTRRDHNSWACARAGSVAQTPSSLDPGSGVSRNCLLTTFQLELVSPHGLHDSSSLPASVRMVHARIGGLYLLLAKDGRSGSILV